MNSSNKVTGKEYLKQALEMEKLEIHENHIIFLYKLCTQCWYWKFCPNNVLL